MREIGESFASLLPPPCHMVIFSSSHSDGDADHGCAETSARMVELAREQPGFLGVESTRAEDGFGITVSDRVGEQAILEWRRHAEHVLARERGRNHECRHFELRVERVERVERAYGGGRTR